MPYTLSNIVLYQLLYSFYLNVDFCIHQSIGVVVSCATMVLYFATFTDESETEVVADNAYYATCLFVMMHVTIGSSLYCVYLEDVK